MEHHKNHQKNVNLKIRVLVVQTLAAGQWSWFLFKPDFYSSSENFWKFKILNQTFMYLKLQDSSMLRNFNMVCIEPWKPRKPGKWIVLHKSQGEHVKSHDPKWNLFESGKSEAIFFNRMLNRLMNSCIWVLSLVSKLFFSLFLFSQLKGKVSMSLIQVLIRRMVI